jgi:hypothetical protein
MSARLELCGVLLIAAALVLWAWQNQQMKRKRLETRVAALLSEIAEVKRRYAKADYADTGIALDIAEKDAPGHLWRSVPSIKNGGKP